MQSRKNSGTVCACQPDKMMKEQQCHKTIYHLNQIITLEFKLRAHQSKSKELAVILVKEMLI